MKLKAAGQKIQRNADISFRNSRTQSATKNKREKKTWKKDRENKTENAKFIQKKRTHTTDNRSGKEFKFIRYAPYKKQMENISPNNSAFIVSPESEFYDSFNFYRFSSLFTPLVCGFFPARLVAIFPFRFSSSFVFSLVSVPCRRPTNKPRLHHIFTEAQFPMSVSLVLNKLKFSHGLFLCSF